MGIVGAHAEKHQEALTDLAVDLAVDGDGGVVDAGNDCAHSKFLLTRIIPPEKGRVRPFRRCQPAGRVTRSTPEI